MVFEIHSDIRVYIGGPVEQDNLYFIHSIPEMIPDSIEIAQGMKICLCALGQSPIMPIKSAFQYFSDEFEKYFKDSKNK